MHARWVARFPIAPGVRDFAQASRLHIRPARTAARLPRRCPDLPLLQLRLDYCCSQLFSSTPALSRTVIALLGTVAMNHLLSTRRLSCPPATHYVIVFELRDRLRAVIQFAEDRRTIRSQQRRQLADRRWSSFEARRWPRLAHTAIDCAFVLFQNMIFANLRFPQQFKAA